MPEGTFLPYRFKPECLDLGILEVNLDKENRTINEYVDSEAHSVTVSSLNDWQLLELKVRVTDPNLELRTLLPEGDIVSDNIAVLLVIRGKSTRSRKGVWLSQAEDGSWEGCVELCYLNQAGSVSIQAIATRARDNKKVEGGYGARKHERLATSPWWQVYVDDKPSLPGGAIKGEWRVFSEDQDSELNSRSDCSWHLDLRDIQRPKLFLNEEIKHLKSALDTQARRGAPARIRDAISHSILQPVLMDLLCTAISENLGSGYEDLEGWQKSLLSTFAQYIGEQSEESAVESWLEDWESGQLASLMPKLSTVVQRYLRAPDIQSNLVLLIEDPGRA